MAVSKEDILESIANMTVIEVVDLISAMEEKFGVSAAPVAVAGGAAGAGAAAEEQTEFNVVLADAGAKKINVIKEVRAITGLGLKEAKEVVDGLGTVMEGVAKEAAEEAKGKLEEAGAVIELK